MLTHKSLRQTSWMMIMASARISLRLNTDKEKNIVASCRRMNLNFILQAIGKIWLTSCTSLSFSSNLRAALTPFAIKIIIPITQIPIQTTSIQSATKVKKEKVVLNIQIPLRFGLVRAILKAVLVFFRNDRLSLVFYVGRIYFKLIPG